MSLIGIARLASQASPLEAKREVEYRQLPTRSLLNRCTSPRMPYFEWTINPYRGCEFGCKYCYARYTHEFMELRSPEQFETLIFAKHFQPAVFRQELRLVKSGQTIAMGTATDPYQPAERRFRLTRKILEVFAGQRGLRLSITTKSDLVARDVDLLERIARCNVLHVNLTVTTVDTALARLLEPRAPRPDLRLRALTTLRGHGIQAGVFACPVLPLINDSLEDLRTVARAASQAGALYFSGNTVFLKPCAKAVFFPFLEKEFPKLAARYHKHFDHADFLSGLYPEAVRDRVIAVRKEFRLARSPEEYAPPEAEGAQMSLF